jgi:hypothetical protein
MKHKSVCLELRVDKPDNVYRYIYAWRPVASGHGPEIFYLLLHALLQWNGVSVDAFCVAMQYSHIPGENVDVSQPVHILEEDLQLFNQAWIDFTGERNRKR